MASRIAAGIGTTLLGALLVSMQGPQCVGAVTYASGSAVLNCTSPCEDHCVSVIITIVGPSGSYPAAACACSSDGVPQQCCSMLLVPPSGSGTGIPFGRCGGSPCLAGLTCGKVIGASGEAACFLSFPF